MPGAVAWRSRAVRPFSPQLYAASASSQSPKRVVQELEVVERGAGRGQHVAPAVVPEVLAAGRTACRSRDELPHAGGAHARVGLRVVGTLDHRQQRNLGRHAALSPAPPPRSRDSGGCARPCAGRTRGELRYRGLVPRHQRAVDLSHGETAADAAPQVAVLGWRGASSDLDYRFSCGCAAPINGSELGAGTTACGGAAATCDPVEFGGVCAGSAAMADRVRRQGYSDQAKRISASFGPS